MKRILCCKIEVDCNEGGTAARNVYVKMVVLDTCTKARSNLRISYGDIVKMLSGTGNYVLEYGQVLFSPESLCNPGGENDFGWVVSLLLNAAYYSGMISKEEFISKVREHYEKYYLPSYYSKSKLCVDFYRRYFLRRTKKKFGDFNKMFSEYTHIIEEKGKSIYLQRGGEFCGCYYDGYARRRPITSPKYYEKVIPIAEKLWVCFVEELNVV